MGEFDIDIRVIDERKETEETAADYVPFGIKVLKLHIRKLAGPNKKIWIRTKQFKRDQDPCAIYCYADDGEDLWAAWGAGDIMGFCAKYAEQAGTKKTVMLDDEEPHTVYLHLIHRPADPMSHQLRDRKLTVVAVTTDDDAEGLAKTSCRDRRHNDRIVAEKTFSLTVPEGADDPLRPVWTRRQDGSGSDIVFQGSTVARYISRWWPSRQVAYESVENAPKIRLNYVRKAKGDEGAVDMWLKGQNGEAHLARVEGHLTLPLHDMRWFVPELYRFYDGRLYALRLSFFWTDEHIDADDLVAYVPDEQKGALRDQATKEAKGIMQPGLLGRWMGWGKQYEIPDVERFDILFDPGRPSIKFACTDAHWREYWVRVDRGEPALCSIAAPKDAYRVVVNHILSKFRDMGKQEPQAVTNPLAEGGIAEYITGGRCYYDPESERIICTDAAGARPKAPGFLGKNAPTVSNANLLDGGLSSDVLEG